MEKFHELWIMNEERCKDMAQKLLEADRIIFEQQLGLSWTPKDLSFMDNTGPIDATKMPKPSIDVVREILTEQDETKQEDVTQSDGHLSNTSMKAILELLCDEGVSTKEESKLVLLIEFRLFLLNQNY